MDIEKITKVFGILIPPLILCSSIRLVTYYSHWGIPIFDYLSTSEILFSFIEPGLIMSILVGIYLVCNLLFLGAIYLIAKYKGKNKSSNTESNVESNLETNKNELSAKQKVIFYIIFGCVLFLGAASMIRGMWYDYSVTTTFLTHITFWVILASGIKLSFFEKSDNALMPVLIATVLTIASASFFYGRFQAHNTSLFPSKRILHIDNGETIETDDELIYLGKTANYYFLFDKML